VSVVDCRRSPRFGLLLAVAIAVVSFACASLFSQGARSRGIQLLPAAPKRYGVLVGIDEYKDKQIPPLRGAAADAKLLRETLVKSSGFPADQLIVLTSDEEGSRYPSRNTIFRQVSNVLRAMPDDGLFLFAFSGHGIDVNGQVFILAADTEISSDPRLLERTAINVSEIQSDIRANQIQQVLMFVDACREDPKGGRSGADNAFTEDHRNAFNFDKRNAGVTAFATLYASSVGERSFEYSDGRGGYFTRAITEALDGFAAENGVVTLASLAHYVQKEVPKRVGLDLGYKQTPFLSMEGYLPDRLIVAGNPDATGAMGAGCPANIGDANSIMSAKLGVDEKLEQRAKAAMVAGVELKALADEIEARVAKACAHFAAALSAETGKSTPKTRSARKTVRTECENASKALEKLKALIKGTLKVQVTPSTCFTPMNVLAECAAKCGTGKAASSVLRCLGGNIVGKCPGLCRGTCELPRGAKCEGTCGGNCTGSCEGNFSGRCEGTCEGRCDGKRVSGKCYGICDGKCEGQASGVCGGVCSGECSAPCAVANAAKCSGKCSGECSEPFQDATCSGELTVLKLSAECKARCDAQVASKISCTGRRIEVRIEQSEDALAAARLKSAIEAHLPELLDISVELRPKFVGTAENVTTSLQAVSRQLMAGGAAAVQVRRCLTASLKAQADAMESIRTTIEASTRARAGI
jgi:hypothetical protein